MRSSSGTLSPRFAWSHDVNGVGPNFNQGVKSQSFGLSLGLPARWVVDAQYTMFIGRTHLLRHGRPSAGVPPTPAARATAPGANPLEDRDFYSVSVSYSF